MRAALLRFRRDGFAVLPGPPAALQDRLRALLGRLDRRALSPAERGRCVMESALRESQRGMALPEGRDAIFILGEPGRLHPAFSAAVAHPRVIAAVSRALGSERLAFHFANVTAKAAGFGSGIAWHRDATNRYMPSRRGAFLRAMICLDGMRPANGGTAFRPGSHRGASRPAVVPRVPRGGLVLIHARVLHGGAPNRSATPRRNLIVQWGRRDDPLVLRNRESQTGRPPTSLARPGRWLTG
ncbi:MULTISPECIES: phytanoyl-CoA dioxygenase family protein [Roseomonadaceae]|uniref:Phytanoyl-CoA dioxygenase family protein n=1 Tax=Falsiroseomonas oleicola TaxID=2801474 RepID=A0ABS6H4H3_9PROT|nr:phytanoyl-CoA dioxygenase family protein [Roseomonas oleicola]MBU8543574.1 phytanoyl-CoA dioxygenase family protein [Roseomonas oleicola]